MTGRSVTVDVIAHLPLPAPGNGAAIESLVRHALAVEGQTGEWTITVVFMSDDELRGLHREFMGLDTVTDIMTFPLGVELGGDLAISVERAAEQGPEFGLTAWEEVRFLVVHGVLHLCGWDDGDETRRGAMLARQSVIIDGWLSGEPSPGSRR